MHTPSAALLLRRRRPSAPKRASPTTDATCPRLRLSSFLSLQRCILKGWHHAHAIRCIPSFARRENAPWEEGTTNLLGVVLLARWANEVKSVSSQSVHCNRKTFVDEDEADTDLIFVQKNDEGILSRQTSWAREQGGNRETLRPAVWLRLNICGAPLPSVLDFRAALPLAWIS